VAARLVRAQIDQKFAAALQFDDQALPNVHHVAQVANAGGLQEKAPFSERELEKKRVKTSILGPKARRKAFLYLFLFSGLSDPLDEVVQIVRHF